jgi:hypothetical protein
MQLGHTFPDELTTAGIIGVVFADLTTGDIRIDGDATPAQITTLAQVCAAHNPASVHYASVTKFQLQAALLNLGYLVDFNTAVAGLSQALQLRWNMLNTFQINDPVIVAVKAATGTTDAVVQDVFVTAAGIS